MPPATSFLCGASRLFTVDKRLIVLATSCFAEQSSFQQCNNQWFECPRHLPVLAAAVSAASLTITADTQRNSGLLCRNGKKDRQAWSTKGGRRLKDNAAPYLDLTDPIKQAFDLTVNYGMKVSEAYSYTKCTTSYQALWARISCHRKN